MERKDGYEQKLSNAGAQEAEALRKRTKTAGKGTAVRGADLRSGK